MTKITKKILLFFLIIFTLQTVISSFDWGIVGFREFELLRKYLNEKIDIIFFGDSSVYTHDPKNDTDKRTIILMLQDTIPELKVMPVVHPAYQMDLYLEFCKYIANSETKPKAVIIPISIRSFSPEWDLQPTYQFTEEKAFMSSSAITTFLLNIFIKPLKVFKYGYENELFSNRKLDNADVYYKDSIVGKMAEYNTGFEDRTEANKRKKFLLRYMFYIDKQHRKLNSLREICRLMLSENVTPIFYIIPLDHEAGAKYFSGEIIDVSKINASLIAEELQALGGKVIDLSLDLNTKDFNYDYYPNEHMKQFGRRHVAVKIAQKMIDIKLINSLD